MSNQPATADLLRAENAELRARLEEAEEMLRAIRAGEVDALVVESSAGPQVFTLQGLDAEQNRFRGEMLAQVSDAVIVVDHEERVTFLNAAAERQYGVRASDMMGRGFAEIYTRHWRAPNAEAGMWTALGERGEWRGELIHRTHAGHELHVEKVVTTLRGPDGAPIGHVAAIRDISERKRAEEDLRESEHFLQRITEVTPGVLHVFDLAKQCSVFVSRSVASVIGYSAEEIAAMGSEIIPTLMHPDDLPRFAEHMLRVRTLGDDEYADFEHRMCAKSGEWRWFQNRDAVFARDGAGAVQQIIGAAMDVTERKRTEDALRLSNERFELAVKCSQVVLFQQDLELRYTWIQNPSPGFDGSDVIGKRDVDLMARAEDAAVTEGLKREVIRAGVGVRQEVLLQIQGVERHYDLLVEPLRDAAGLISGVTCAAVDITERKRTEEALRTSEEHLRYALGAAHAGAWNWNIQTGAIAWSPENYVLYDLDPVQGPPRYEDWESRVHPEDRDRANEHVRAALEGREAEFRTEFRIVSRQGATRWLLGLGRVERDGDGQALRMSGINLDITARKHAEEAQRRSEEFARSQWAEAEAALEAVPANIAILDADGVIVRVNNGWTSFASRNGLAPGSVAVGVNYLAVCKAVTGPEARQAKAFADGIRSVIGGKSDRFSMEYTCHSPEEQRWPMGYVTITIGPGPARAVVAHVDISAQKRTEEQIRILNAELESRVAERTAELRTAVDALETQFSEAKRLKTEVLRVSEEERLRVAADLHDGICQELVGIQLFAHTLQDKLEKAGDPLAAEARRIQEAMAGTMDHTRQVARGMNPVVADGSGLMYALRQLADTTAHSRRVHCSFHCPEPVPIDDPKLANELYRIAQEAIYNAVRHGQAERITVRLSASGGAGRLAVRDNGSGLPADHVRAPGMGLRVMRYRAGVIGGQLVVQPRRGGGTEVICRFSQSSDRQ